MQAKQLLPKIIVSKAQCNRILQARSQLVWAKKHFERHVEFHAGPLTHAREAALESEIAEFGLRIDAYKCSYMYEPKQLKLSRQPAEQPAQRKLTVLDFDSIDDLGAALCRTRIQLGLPRAALARAVGISNCQLGRHEQALYAHASLTLIQKVQRELAKSWRGEPTLAKPPIP
ncbi:MAG TPA: hypothetical protein V6D22_15770 [Candidatus Obscuribacterales bacterium]